MDYWTQVVFLIILKVRNTSLIAKQLFLHTIVSISVLHQTLKMNFKNVLIGYI